MEQCLESDADHMRRALAAAFRSPALFSQRILHRPLRSYQLAPARAIIDSVLRGRGLTFAVMMARQAGKNETAAQVEAFLLQRFARRGGSLIKAAPTFQPQSINSLLRLRGLWAGSSLPPLVAERGYMLRHGQAQIAFFSAAAGANVVGATANILLEADEAQDIDVDKWNKDFRPMGASTNVTTVLWGTAWTAQTLLAQTIASLRQLEVRDGVQRVFLAPWQQVAAEAPAYGRYVRAEIARLGADHPLIRTQYALEAIDGQGGMFPAATRALMQGTHARQRQPQDGQEYALLVDVAGEAEEHLEGALLRALEPRKDSTAVTVVALERLLGDLPRYRVVDRHWWTGQPHHTLYRTLVSLAERWQARRVIVDATGVGAGVASFLKQALGARVTPIHFTAKSKSDLGWDFRGICDSGRFQDYVDDGEPEWRQFWREVQAADYQVVEGPNRLMRWGVADPTVHDDLLISAALCAWLDDEEGHLSMPAVIIEAPEVL
jgi:hypothetical protein